MPTQIRIPFGVDATGGIAVIGHARDVDRQSMITLLGTQPGERVMRPGYGVATRDLLFDLDDAILVQQLDSGIQNAVSTYAPEIRLVDLSFDGQGDDGVVQIELEYEPGSGRLNTGSDTIATTVGVGGL